jgi:hypothetical protein
MEMSGVMDLGAIGKDGRQGGRLEREVALYEESVMRKRKGYREKVKARESAGGEEDRGEPDSKKIRRISEEDEDEEERMLEQQLNGTTAAEEAAGQDANGNTESSNVDVISVAVGIAHRNGKEKAIPVSDGPDEDEDVDDADDAEDDGAGDEEADHADETEDDDDENEDGSGDDEETENDDVDDARLTNGRRRGLLPNGEVEIASDEESD